MDSLTEHQLKTNIIARWPYISEQLLLITPVSGRVCVTTPIRGRWSVIHQRLNEVIISTKFGKLKLTPSGIMSFDIKKRFSSVYGGIAISNFTYDQIYSILNELEVMIAISICCTYITMV